MLSLKSFTSARVLLYIYSFLFKVYGLFPWNITLFFINQTKLTNQANQVIRKSYYKHVYNIFLIVLYISLHIGLYTQVHETNDLTGTTTVVRECLIYFALFTTLIILTYFIVQSKTLSNAVDQLVRIDQILDSCSGYILINNSGRLYLFLINFLICFGTSFLRFRNHLIRFLTWNVPAALCSCVLTQYSLIIHIIINRITSVNDYLLKLNRLSIHIEIQSIFSIKLPITRSIDSEITNIKNAYIKLYAVCQQIVNFYTFPTLFAILCLSWLSVYSGYFCLLTHFGLAPFSLRERIVQSVWIFLTSCDLIILSAHVNIFINEKKRTVDNIHWILNTYYIEKNTEKKFKELSEFLLHEKTPFKIYEMMTLDGSLLYVISSTAVSYLIILIQFRFYNDDHT